METRIRLTEAYSLGVALSWLLGGLTFVVHALLRVAAPPGALGLWMGEALPPEFDSLLTTLGTVLFGLILGGWIAGYSIIRGRLPHALWIRALGIGGVPFGVSAILTPLSGILSLVLFGLVYILWGLVVEQILKVATIRLEDHPDLTASGGTTRSLFLVETFIGAVLVAMGTIAMSFLL